MTKKNKKMYQFAVPCNYLYEISANGENQARKILLSEGGLDIDGELVFDDNAYKDAELIDVLEI